jgi:hypothetical protein
VNLGLIGIYKGSQNGFQQLPLSLEIYSALKAIDEEIYVLRLRSITGSARAFALI